MGFESDIFLEEFDYFALYSIVTNTDRPMYRLDLLHLIEIFENTFDWKRIYANPSSYPNCNPNTNPNPNSNPNPVARELF